jgi:hypothetical protein
LTLGRGLVAALVFRTEPADNAVFLFLCPLMIQGHQPGKNLSLGQVRRPAVGLGNGRVQFIMKLAQGAHKSLLIGDALGFC